MAASPPPESAWFQFIKGAYPHFQSQTYFVPPIHYNRVPSYVANVSGQATLVLDHPQRPPSKRNHRSRRSQSSRPSSHQLLADSSPVAGTAFKPNLPGVEPPRVQHSDVQDDLAQGHVLQCLRVWAEKTQQAMMVLSQLQFKKYLDKDTDPVRSAASALLPQPSADGECDLLIIHRRYSIVVAEIKSVGGHPGFFAAAKADQRKTIVEKVQKAVDQLNKQSAVLSDMVKDLGVKVTKTLILPNISSTQLLSALRTDKSVMQAVLQCLGAPDTSSAVKCCLCQDGMPDRQQLHVLNSTLHLSTWNQLRYNVSRLLQRRQQLPQPMSGTSFPSSSFPSSSSSSGGSMATLEGWWRETVVKSGTDPAMTADIYTRLVARFCGPATTVDIPTLTPMRKEIRTHGEAVAETGLRISRLALYPDQVDLLSSPLPPCVYLQGPPGTGKTVMLVLKATQWLNQGKHVHLVSVASMSRAVTALIHHQLKVSLPVLAATNLHCHYYDFDQVPGDETAALKKLVGLAAAAAAKAAVAAATSTARVLGCAEFNVVMDEVTVYSERFLNFLARLRSSVSTLCLWSAGLFTEPNLPSWMHVQPLTAPLRCPPTVHRQVAQAHWLGRQVPQYSSPCSSCPPRCEGPAVKWLKHQKQQYHAKVASPGDCARCGEELALEFRVLGVGEPGCVQYKDILILANRPDNGIAMVLELRSQGIPVKVVKASDPLNDVMALALAEDDQVVVTDAETASGLERRVVIGMDRNGMERLWSMSRCTSQLFWIDHPGD